MKKSLFILFIIITATIPVLLLSGCKTKELSSKEIERRNHLSEKIGKQDYTFKARSTTPSGYRTINLTSEYTLRVAKDSIEAFLPYFGRAYVAPIDPSEGGIKFTSTKFVYNIQKKKNSWEVKIDTKDTNGNIRLFLSIGKTGYATLSIQDTNRQPISFYGIIENDL